MGKDFLNRLKGLYAIIDTTYTGAEEAGETAKKIIEGGAGILQLRAKGAGSGEFLRLARAVGAVARAKGALFIVNDRVDIALMTGADGVHLGQEDIPVEDARRLLGGGAVIGVSTHNLSEALQADRSRADYISFGPVFPTGTKKDAEPVTGTAALKEVKDKVKKPIVAIGGITEEKFPEVLKSGAAAAAIISDILNSRDIRGKVAAIIAKTGQ
ncbi:MAG: thiamine phosphate synthase [Thermodesulfobacteriota bacterium]